MFYSKEHHSGFNNYLQLVSAGCITALFRASVYYCLQVRQYKGNVKGAVPFRSVCGSLMSLMARLSL